MDREILFELIERNLVYTGRSGTSPPVDDDEDHRVEEDDEDEAEDWIPEPLPRPLKPVSIDVSTDQPLVPVGCLVALGVAIGMLATGWLTWAFAEWLISEDMPGARLLVFVLIESLVVGIIPFVYFLRRLD